MANQFIYANFLATDLVTRVGVGDTVINIPPTDAMKLPNFSSGFYAPLSLWDGVNPPEIVWCTANSQTGALVVLRGQEGTSAFGWSAGTQVRSSITASVLNAALAAYNSGQVLIANYLPLTGGTLTGPLTLSGLPVSALQAASKSYVDASIGGLLPLAGGSMSGNINMASNRILALPAPITGAEPATKSYVDADFSLVSNIAADRSGQLVTGGTGAAYTLTSNTGYGPTLADGIQVAFRVHATNQAAPTLALDGTAAVPLRGKSGAALVPGRVAVGTVWAAEYRLAGPEWILLDYRVTATVGAIGGPSAYAVTTGLAIATLQDGLELEVQLNAANNGAMTLNVDTLGATPLRPASGVEYVAGSFAQYNILPIRYNAATSEWIVKGPPPAPIGTNSLSYSTLTNVGLTIGQATNVLTVNLKTLSGADASVSNPINIPFADPAGGGLPVWRQVTSALSVATIVGATFGVGNNVPFRLWVAIFDNAGTPQLALSLRSLLGTGGAANFYTFDENMPQSTVAMSGGSTSPGVWYTGAGVTLSSKSFRVLGYIDFTSGLATAGSFNAASPPVHLFGTGIKKPGEVIQALSVSSTTLGSTTSNTFAILTSGTTLTITPTNSCNLVRVHSEGTLSGSSANAALVQLGRGPATPANLIGNPTFVGVAGGASVPARLFSYDQPSAGVPAAVVYGFQGHSTGGATTSYPTASSGVILEAEELQA